MEEVEVDAERDAVDVAGPDAIELGAGELRGAHHRVVSRGGPCVRDVRGGTRPGTRHRLREKPIETLVRDHHRHGAPTSGPGTEPTQREPVGDLECVGRQAAQDVGHPTRVGDPVPARPRDGRCGDGDPVDPGREHLLVGAVPRHDERDLMSPLHVAVAELVDGGAQPARPRPVEVGDLHDAHVRSVAPSRRRQVSVRWPGSQHRHNCRAVDGDVAQLIPEKTMCNTGETVKCGMRG